MERLAEGLRAALTYLFLGLASFLSVFPFLWMVIGATP